MKVRVKHPFFDDKGIHKIGDIVDVEKIDGFLMEPVKEPKKAEKKTSKVTEG